MKYKITLKICLININNKRTKVNKKWDITMNVGWE